MPELPVPLEPPCLYEDGPYPEAELDPAAKWEHPDGYWTPELSAAVDECRAGVRSTIPCPACGTETTAATVDEIHPEIFYPNSPIVRVARIGSVVTLHPCGHALKRHS